MENSEENQVKEESYILASLITLKPEPTPRGMSSQEIVRRAIEFGSPPRIPYYFLFHPNAADIVFLGPLTAASRPTHGKPGERYVDDWGVTWQVTGRYWDHAIEFPLADLRNLASYKFPDYTQAISKIKVLVHIGNAAGKYVLGLNPINMFERLRSIMGFEELMMAPYTQPDNFHRLLDKLCDQTIAVIKTYDKIGGVHGFETVEDWGLQKGLQMKIDTFREFYKPYYKRIIDACHNCGMHFFWHNCGYIVDMFPDMIDLGVDVLQLDQPRLTGHQRLIEYLGGKICMWNPVDIQWSTLGDITENDIRQEVSTMVSTYNPGRFQGGFIAKHYPQPWDIQLSPKRQKLIYQAFMENGCRLS